MRIVAICAASLLAACTFEGAPVGGDDPIEEFDERTLTFEFGDDYTGVFDTEVDEDNPALDRSALDQMRLDTSTGNSQGRVMSLLRFDEIFGDGPGQVPANAQVRLATLSLTVVNRGDDAGFLCDMVRDWQPSTAWDGFGTDGPQALSDYDPTPIANIPGEAELHELDVRTSVTSWHTGTAANHGWILLPASDSGIAVATSEAESGRPSLELTIRVPK